MPFKQEVAAIRAIRDRNTGIGAYALATKIFGRKFPANTPDYNDTGNAGVPQRTKLSVLSVIRRHDASKQAVPA